MSRLEQCLKCKNYYTITQIGGNFPGSKEPEEIECPHDNCDFVRTEMSNGVFKTHKAEAPK